MQLVKNNAPRLITLNFRDGDTDKKFRLIPAGKPAPVPSEALKSHFARIQLALGNISIVGAAENQLEPAEDEGEDGKRDDLEDMRDEAKALGIKVDRRWSEHRLRVEIDKALDA